MSGIGKGITTSSIGRVLKDYGFSVTAMKIDPYLNVDAGTLNPIVHGEVFVTDDGTEGDQDLGNYERFLETDMSRKNIMTSGLVYQTVIQRERNLEYGGQDVEMMSEIPNEVMRRFKDLSDTAKTDFVQVDVRGGRQRKSRFFGSSSYHEAQRPRWSDLCPRKLHAHLEQHGRNEIQADPARSQSAELGWNQRGYAHRSRIGLNRQDEKGKNFPHVQHPR